MASTVYLSRVVSHQRPGLRGTRRLGTSAEGRRLATADLRGMESTSRRFSANIVYSLDNTAGIAVDTEIARRRPSARPLRCPSRIERFGLSVPDRSRRLPPGRGCLPRRGARPPLHRGAHTRPEQPPGLAVPREQRQPRPLPGDRLDHSVHADDRQPFLPVEAWLLTARRDRHRAGRYEELYRGVVACTAMVDLFWRGLGGRHLGSASRRQDQDGREARREGIDQGPRRRLRPRERKERPHRWSDRRLQGPR